MYSPISFRMMLFIPSCPLLLLFGRRFISLSSSYGVVRCRNKEFSLLLIELRYSSMPLLDLAILFAYLLATVEKYSPNLFVISSGLCSCWPFELRYSMMLVLSLIFPAALLISPHSSLVLLLFSAHLDSK